MREIKFRALAIDTNRWVYGYLLKDKASGAVRIAENFVCIDILEDGAMTTLADDIHLVNPKTVGEFTGLHDKNGKEIYESDILAYDLKGDQRKARVYKMPGGFIIKAAAWSGNLKELTPSDELIVEPLADAQVRSFVQQGCEVIGNVYENPEPL